MTWICRYTSMRPDDVLNMTPWQFRVVTEHLLEIIQAESGKEL
jgi:hypothetical protein